MNITLSREKIVADRNLMQQALQVIVSSVVDAKRSNFVS